MFKQPSNHRTEPHVPPYEPRYEHVQRSGSGDLPSRRGRSPQKWFPPMASRQRYGTFPRDADFSWPKSGHKKTWPGTRVENSKPEVFRENVWKCRITTDSEDQTMPLCLEGTFRSYCHSSAINHQIWGCSPIVLGYCRTTSYSWLIESQCHQVSVCTEQNRP